MQSGNTYIVANMYHLKHCYTARGERRGEAECYICHKTLIKSSIFYTNALLHFTCIY